MSFDSRCFFLRHRFCTSFGHRGGFREGWVRRVYFFVFVCVSPLAVHFLSSSCCATKNGTQKRPLDLYEQYLQQAIVEFLQNLESIQQYDIQHTSLLGAAPPRPPCRPTRHYRLRFSEGALSFFAVVKQRYCLPTTLCYHHVDKQDRPQYSLHHRGPLATTRPLLCCSPNQVTITDTSYNRS